MDTSNYEQTTRRSASMDDAVSTFMTRVYAWMGFALLITGLTTYVVAGSDAAMSFIYGNSFVFYGMLIAELILVIVIAAAINKISPQVASFLFVLYSLLTGATLASIFMIYTHESIATTFFVSAGVFVLMSIYGMITKRDLTKLGNILIMALLGLIIATVVNIFWANTTLYWITTYAGVLIFIGLIAFDTQKLKRIATQANDSETAAKLSILGALTLYLDLINIFLYLLRIFGNRRN